MYKKYIKINKENRITDVFFNYQKEKFDGTEIFLEDVEKIKHKINDKSISDEYGNFIFEYKNKKIIENDIYANERSEKKANEEKDNKIKSFDINILISDLIDKNKLSMANLETEIKKYFEV